MSYRSYAWFKWLRSIDKVTLVLTLVIASIGIVLITSSGPVIARKIGLAQNHFIKSHAFNLCLSVVLMIVCSCLSDTQIKSFCKILFILFILLTVLTLLKSSGIKGSKRWINFFGFSLQPSEFLKPFFSVFCALLLSQSIKKFVYVIFFYLLISAILLLQPDFGMFVLISIIFLTATFVSRVNIFFVPMLLCAFLIIATCAYFYIPHVKRRIDNFANKESSANFQVKKAAESISSGGLKGVGPSQGRVKLNLPDAHTDFIFSVAAEEFGFVLTFSIITLYFALFMRNISRFYLINDEFKCIASACIIIYLASQTLINIGVNLHLLPTKGMTLPFISYGGSSLMSCGTAVGMLLALSKTSYKFVPR